MKIKILLTTLLVTGKISGTRARTVLSGTVQDGAPLFNTSHLPGFFSNPNPEWRGWPAVPGKDSAPRRKVYISEPEEVPVRSLTARYVIPGDCRRVFYKGDELPPQNWLP